MVVAVAPAAAAPTASHIVSPDPPVAGQVTTFTSNSTPDPATGSPITFVEWNLAGGPEFEQDGNPTTFPYGSCGLRAVQLRVVDADGVDDIETFTVDVQPGPIAPIAQFRFSPTSPSVGQEVLFESQSFDPDGELTRFAWDFDGDGFDDGASASVPHTFSTPGPKTARLRVYDNSCRFSTVAAESLTVSGAASNRLPVAQFSISPLRPVVGRQVSLRSFSYDPDGSIVAQRWDLDGDGDFDENINGPTAFTVFPKRGERLVRLQVRDSGGAVQTETLNVNVRPRPASAVALINPFPVARLAGSVYPGGVRVRILEVRTPAKSKVVVRCFGQSCPAKELRKTSKKKPVRFKSMSRFLRAGTVLKVSIRKRGQIGKYTRWLIRGGKLPKRQDLCLYPGRSKGRPCP